jgi:hypothetical protein
VFRADFLGFQMRYKVLKMGTQYEPRTPKFRLIASSFSREFVRYRWASESLSRGFEVRLWVPNSKHNLANLLLVIVHYAAMILFMLCPRKDDG